MRAGSPFTVFAALFVALTSAAFGEGDWTAANQLYEQGKFSDAKLRYEQLVDGGAWSANLFYNLGNVDNRLGAPGRAILNYERALALDPSHPEARANVQLLRSQTGAKLRAAAWWDRALFTRSANFWTIAAAAAGWLALVGTSVILRSKREEKAVWWLLTVCGVAGCALAVTAIWTLDRERTLAIVTAKLTEARLAPADSAGLAEALPAGSRVRVLSERGEWVYCALPGEGRGWIPRGAIEQVRLRAPQPLRG